MMKKIIKKINKWFGKLLGYLSSEYTVTIQTGVIEAYFNNGLPKATIPIKGCARYSDYYKHITITTVEDRARYWISDWKEEGFLSINNGVIIPFCRVDRFNITVNGTDTVKVIGFSGASFNEKLVTEKPVE